MYLAFTHGTAGESTHVQAHYDLITGRVEASECTLQLMKQRIKQYEYHKNLSLQQMKKIQEMFEEILKKGDLTEHSVKLSPQEKDKLHADVDKKLQGYTEETDLYSKLKDLYAYIDRYMKSSLSSDSSDTASTIETLRYWIKLLNNVLDLELTALTETQQQEEYIIKRIEKSMNLFNTMLSGRNQKTNPIPYEKIRFIADRAYAGSALRMLIDNHGDEYVIRVKQGQKVHPLEIRTTKKKALLSYRSKTFLGVSKEKDKISMPSSLVS